MIRVTCAIIIRNYEVLVVQRSASMRLPLKWEFPGGKVERGETDEDCIKRELLEELNINIEVLGKMREFFYDYGDLQITLIPFLAILKSDHITLTEHVKYEWLPQEKLIDLDWAPADIAVVKELLKSRAT